MHARFISALLVMGALLLSACHHQIDPSNLSPPPDEPLPEGPGVSMQNPEEVKKELEAIAQTPYPAYTIQGGDIFRVRVYNEESLDTAANAATVVTPDGYLVMSLIEPIMVKNLTITQATDKVREAMSKFLKYPYVSLVPEKIQGKEATLFGAVREPGKYPVTDNTRLTDFIAAGRGSAVGILDDNTVDMADFTSSYLIRDGKVLPVDFYKAIHDGDPLHNIRIFPSDIVFIAKREDSRVFVIGEVKRPRIVNWTRNTTFIEVLGQAEGLADEHWGIALVLRRPKERGGALAVYRINISDTIAGRSPNYNLASGDILYIPKDELSEYNVFIKKLIPTAQLVNLIMTPVSYWYGNKR